MATMYSLFFVFLFNAVCLPLGISNSVLAFLYQGRDSFCRSKAATGPVPFVLTQKGPKSQGLVKSYYTVLNTSEPFRYATLLRSFIDGLSNAKDKASSSFCTFTQMSPNKFFAYAGSLRPTAKNFQRHAFAYFWLDKSMSTCHGLSGKRKMVLNIASAELGVREATGNNDGPRVEEYLRYTDLGPGHEWCAAYVSWCYGQAGLSEPRNPWSPALFPNARRYKNELTIQVADLFGIYGSNVKRINHVGIIKNKLGQYIITIEGNSNNSVESRRRHVKTIYAYADWLGDR